jgi:hypothetical protein
VRVEADPGPLRMRRGRRGLLLLLLMRRLRLLVRVLMRRRRAGSRRLLRRGRLWLGRRRVHRHGGTGEGRGGQVRGGGRRLGRPRGGHGRNPRPAVRRGGRRRGGFGRAWESWGRKEIGDEQRGERRRSPLLKVAEKYYQRLLLLLRLRQTPRTHLPSHSYSLLRYTLIISTLYSSIPAYLYIM